jgi:hypothetical protein
MQRILIRHIAGSRANQVDEFQAQGLREIVAGREEGTGIHYPDGEDLVSRAHARIYAEPPGSDAYYIADLQSRNGTFLNRQRISAPSRLHHDDVVQLGSNGPEFRWELDPAPAAASRPTRVIGAGGLLAGTGMRATRIAATPDNGAPRPVGRATVERMLDETFGRVKRESGKTMWVGIAAVILLMAGGVFAWFYVRHTASQNAERLQEQRQMLVQMAGVVNQQPKNEAAVRMQMDKLTAELKRIASQGQGSQAQAAQTSGAASTAPGSATAAPPASYDAGLTQVAQYYNSGDYQNAYTECVQIIGMDQSRWEGYYYAGLAAAQLGRPSDALTALQYALSDAPDDQKAQITAQINALQGQQPQAN